LVLKEMYVYLKRNSKVLIDLDVEEGEKEKEPPEPSSGTKYKHAKKKVAADWGDRPNNKNEWVALNRNTKWETEICKPETKICKQEIEISKQEIEISAPRTKYLATELK
jgi:hypothetical protein